MKLGEKKKSPSNSLRFRGAGRGREEGEEKRDKVGQSHPYSSLAGQNKKDLAPKSIVKLASENHKRFSVNPTEQHQHSRCQQPDQMFHSWCWLIVHMTSFCLV